MQTRMLLAIGQVNEWMAGDGTVLSTEVQEMG